ncbi:MAG: fatty acid desaturase [Proteobacteria bacterium]|nr:fatty acid desaturase [Pseudomonadota bacterium]
MVFRNSADRLPSILIIFLTCLDFVVYFTVDSVVLLGLYFLLGIFPKGCICAWNHHHQHIPTYRFKPLNRLLELSYAFHTGVTTHLWLLHHVLGHHHHYLDQSRDESRWKRADGSTMGALEYTLDVAATAYYRGYQVGRKHPRLYRTHLICTLVTLLLLGILTWYQPVQALFVFILPMITGLLITAWATYDHHAGLDTADDFEASYNNLNPLFNLLTGNLGYHTAHHYKQGVHWSQLPELHEEIKDRIPQILFRESLWDVVTDNPVVRFLNRIIYRLTGLNT